MTGWHSDKMNVRLARHGLQVGRTFLTDNTVYVRTARKAYRCMGQHDGQQRVPCNQPINFGTDYIEYVGESGACQSGHRYHLDCAITQGLVEKKAA